MNVAVSFKAREQIGNRFRVASATIDSASGQIQPSLTRREGIPDFIPGVETPGYIQ